MDRVKMANVQTVEIQKTNVHVIDMMKKKNVHFVEN